MFQFKQFVIQQGRTPMKVGTDGVLLGAWADVDRTKAVLDIGTGTGLIALMGAQRNHSALVHAIEIEPEACQTGYNYFRLLYKTIFRKYFMTVLSAIPPFSSTLPKHQTLDVP